MKHYLKITIILLILSSCYFPSKRETNQEPKETQLIGSLTRNSFPVGVWFEGAPSAIQPCNSEQPINCAEKYYLKALNDFKEMELNTVVITNIPDPYLHVFLKLAETYKINVIPHSVEITGLIESLNYDKLKETIDRYVKEFNRYQALMGYYLIDEPKKENIKGIQAAQRYFSEFDSKRSVYSCFVGHPKTKSLMKALKFPTYLIDIYPFHSEKSESGKSPLGDLSKSQWGKSSFGEIISKYYHLAKNASLWVVMQAFGYQEGKYEGDRPEREPLPGEIKLQVHEAISNGAKGIIYFVYQTECDWIGIVDGEGARTPKFKEIVDASNFLNENASFLSNISELERKDLSFDLKATFFKSKDNFKKLFVFNRNLAKNICGTINFSKQNPVDTLKFIDISVGTVSEEKPNDKETLSFRFCLDKGEARFFDY
jgi:hypothetical protein